MLYVVKKAHNPIQTNGYHVGEAEQLLWLVDVNTCMMRRASSVERREASLFNRAP
jgi:hypothetical protein